jgi:hypothetical protein
MVSRIGKSLELSLVEADACGGESRIDDQTDNQQVGIEKWLERLWHLNVDSMLS